MSNEKDVKNEKAEKMEDEKQCPVDVTTPRKIDLNLLCHVSYLLYALGFVYGVSAIIAVILIYIKKDEAAGTLFESHFNWLIKTFWVGLALAIAGIFTMIFMVGFLLLAAAAIWTIYRVVKGWVALYERRPAIPKNILF